MMRSLGWSEPRLAEEAGISQGYVNLLRRGRLVDIDMAVRVSRALGGAISPDDLLTPESRKRLRWLLEFQGERAA